MIQPRNDRVLIKPIEADEMTPGGILLSDSAKEKPTRGEVIAIGPGNFDAATRNFVPITGIKRGDVVLFSKYANQEVKDGGETFYLLDQESVFATVHASA